MIDMQSQNFTFYFILNKLNHNTFLVRTSMYDERHGGGEAITLPSHTNMEKVGDHIKVMCYMHKIKGPGWHMSILVL